MSSFLLDLTASHGIARHRTASHGIARHRTASHGIARQLCSSLVQSACWHAGWAGIFVGTEPWEFRAQQEDSFSRIGKQAVNQGKYDSALCANARATWPRRPPLSGASCLACSDLWTLKWITRSLAVSRPHPVFTSVLPRPLLYRGCRCLVGRVRAPMMAATSGGNAAGCASRSPDSVS
jgi:hypothetical protein